MAEGFRGETQVERVRKSCGQGYLHGGLYDTNVAGMPGGGGILHGIVPGLV